MDIMRGFSMVGFPSNFPNVQKFFWKGERLGESELLIYNERTFSMVGFPSNLPNFQKFSWKVFVCGTPCYWYITRGLFQTTPPPQGTLHDGFLVRANSAVHRHKEPCIRNPWPPSNIPTERRGIAAFGRRPLSVYPPRRVFAPRKSFESR